MSYIWSMASLERERRNETAAAVTPSREPGHGKAAVAVLAILLAFNAAGICAAAYGYQQQAYISGNSASFTGILSPNTSMPAFGYTVITGSSWVQFAYVFTPYRMTVYVDGSAAYSTSVTYQGHLVWTVNGQTFNFTKVVTTLGGVRQ